MEESNWIIDNVEHTHTYDVYSRERNVYYVFITKDMKLEINYKNHTNIILPT